MIKNKSLTLVDEDDSVIYVGGNKSSQSTYVVRQVTILPSHILHWEFNLLVRSVSYM